MMNSNQIRQTLRELEINPDKSMGQNFLINPIAVRKIVKALNQISGNVLEIGPGLGALTERLVSEGYNLSAIELCEPMAKRLEDVFPSLKIIQGDFLATNPSDIPGYPFKAVISNLPYNISSQTVFSLCEPQFNSVEIAVLMFQKELAERLICLEGGRDYGRLALMVWPWFSIEKLFDLAPGDFLPRPKIDSSVVVLKRKTEQPFTRDEYVSFIKIVKAAFAGRRKKVSNCLTRVFGKDKSFAMLEAAGVNPDLRAERITPEEFAEITRKAQI